MIFKKVAAAVAVAALAAVGAIAAAPAMAADMTYDSWVEGDDTTPLPVTHGLVFYKNAGISFGDGTEAAHNKLGSLAGLDGLAYTVSKTSSSATSYQIGVVNDTTKVNYARLVWIPSSQVPTQAETGEYTGLENGLWWAGNVWVNGVKTTPFAGADGSQSKPKALNFFIKYFGDDAKVDFFGLSEGLNNDNTSTVTSLTFEGTDVPLGIADKTPFDSSDVDDAVAKATAPLKVEIAALKAELADAENAATATASDRALAKVNDAAAAKANVVTIFGPKKVGKTVSAKAGWISGSTHAYQWLVDGKAVKGATKSSFKLPRSSANDSLSVTIKTSWTDARKIVHSVIGTTTSTRVAYISR